MNSRTVVAACLLVLAAGCFVPGARALDPNRGYYQYEYGEPPDGVNLPYEILDVVEDQQGFLWLATPRGLIRFDGLDTAVYRTSRFPGLPSNRPTRLFVDSTNRLFVASERGTSVLIDGRFLPLTDGAEGRAKVTDFAEDASGAVWLGTADALWRFADGTTTRVNELPAPPQIGALLWHGGRLYVGSRGKIFILDNSSLQTLVLPGELDRMQVLDLELHQGDVWGTTRAGLFRLRGESALAVDNPMLADVAADVLLSDREGSLWFAGGRVVGRILPDGSVELPDVVDEDMGYAPEITRLLEDSLGQHWHASRSFGLLMLRDTAVKRISYTEGLDSTNATAVAGIAGGPLLVATDRGVSAVDDSAIVEIVNQADLGGKTVRTMSVGADGVVYLGTDESLFSVVRREARWQILGEPVEAAAPVNAILTSADGYEWVATDNGLYRLRDRRLEPFTASLGRSIRSLYNDSRGNLWVGTDAGVARLVDGALVDEATDGGRPQGTVVAFAELPSGKLAVATADHGVYIQSTDNWLRFGERHGVPPEQIIDIEARGKYLWLVTGAGIFRTPIPTELAGARFDLRPIVAMAPYRARFISNCCRGNNASASLIHRGDIVVTSDDGIVILDTAFPGTTQDAPRAYITAVSSGGVPQTIGNDRHLKLAKGSNSLRIDYSAVQLAHGRQVEFRYRLRGLEDKWVYAGGERSVSFLNLPPGSMQFELQASLYPGEWSADVAGFSMQRTPLLFERTPFRFLLWFLVVAAGFAAVGIWLGAARLRQQRIEKQIVERTRELSELNIRLESANQDLEWSTQTDPLTGLLNRRFFDKQRRSADFNGRVPTAGLLLMIDIDFFKRINDNHGHAAGDKILLQFSELLQSVVRQSDLVARWGGEEFVAICHCPPEEASAMLDRLCRIVREHEFSLSNGQSLDLSCSLGAVRFPLRAGDSLDVSFPALLNIADAMLYAVKHSGRDGWGLIEAHGTIQADAFESPASHAAIIRQLDALVDNDSLRFSSSRKEISLATKNTLTAVRSLPLGGQ